MTAPTPPNVVEFKKVTKRFGGLTIVRDVTFCVPNIPALVPRTATVALSNILLPYVSELARAGPERTLHGNPTLGRGFYTHAVRCLKKKIAAALDLPFGNAESEWTHEYAR